jgi:hypothetical protein
MRTASARTQGALAATLVGLQVLLATVTVALHDVIRGGLDSFGPVAALLGGTYAVASGSAFAVVGLLIVVRRPGNAIGWLFVLANLGWSVSNAATAWVERSVIGPPLPAAEAIAWLATWPGPLSLVAYILLVLLFPTGRASSARWRRVGSVIVGFGAAHAVLAAVASGPIESLSLDGFTVDNPLGLPGPLGAIASDLANGPLELLSIAWFAVAAASLVVRLRRAVGLERQQLKWLTFGVVLTVALWTANVPIMIAWASLADAPAWAQAANALLTSSGVLIPIAAAVAILRHRLYEIDRIISRTISYGVVTALLGGTYVAAFVALQALLAPLTAGQGPAVAASTLVVFALFAPVRRRTQAIVDRRFNRSRYDAAREVDTFAVKVRDDVDVERVAQELAATLHRTMQPRSAAVWLRGSAR